MDTYRLYKGYWIFNDAPNKEKRLSHKEACAWLERGGLMLRNTYDFDCDETTKFWYVIKDVFGGYEELSRNTRNQVRKGYKNFTIKPISKDILRQQGYNVYRQAILHYKTNARLVDEETFMRDIANMSDNMELWGAYSQIENKLAAYAICRIQSNYCSYANLKGTPDALKNYAYYALIFEMNKHYLTERHMPYVSDGARSMTEHSNIQPFLMDKFQFRKAYCHLNIYSKSWLKPFLFLLCPLRKLIPNRSIRAVLKMYSLQG